MELLTELWDKTTDAFTAFSEGVSEGLVRLFGSSNERRIRHMRAAVAQINELEPSMRALSDGELRAKTDEFRQRRAKGEPLDDLLPEAFAAARVGAAVLEYASFRRAVNGRRRLARW